MTKDEALKLALDALEESTDTERTYESFERGDIAITAIKDVLAQPSDSVEQEAITVQEAWVACGGNPGIRATKSELVTALKMLDEVCDEVQPKKDVPNTHIEDNLTLAQQEQEPLEYWNAVEGWVKIDEVRQHFETVSCGTIYKNAGEGRVPLYTTPPKRKEWVGLTGGDMDDITSTAMDKADAMLLTEARLKELNHD